MKIFAGFLILTGIINAEANLQTVLKCSTATGTYTACSNQLSGPINSVSVAIVDPQFPEGYVYQSSQPNTHYIFATTGDDVWECSNNSCYTVTVEHRSQSTANMKIRLWENDEMTTQWEENLNCTVQIMKIEERTDFVCGVYAPSPRWRVEPQNPVNDRP